MIGLPGALLYYLYWSDQAEQTGRRNWDRWRNLSAWTWVHRWFPLTYQFAFAQALRPITEPNGGQYLFLLDVNHYVLSTLLAFGLHGGNPHLQKLNLVWTLPWVFFRVPLVRDVLLWSGAISDERAVVIRAINSGHSVVHCIGGFTAPGAEATNQQEQEDLFRVILAKQMTLVPVRISGEGEMFPTYASPLVRSVQAYCKRTLGHPLVYAVSPVPARRALVVSVAVPVAPKDHTPESLQEAYGSSLGILDGNIV